MNAKMKERNIIQIRGCEKRRKEKKRREKEKRRKRERRNGQSMGGFFIASYRVEQVDNGM